MHRQAAGGAEARFGKPAETGQHEGFYSAALVDLSLPDDVVGLLGARLDGGVFDAFKDDTGIHLMLYAVVRAPMVLMISHFVNLARSRICNFHNHRFSISFLFFCQLP